jgi:hypothetical protein
MKNLATLVQGYAVALRLRKNAVHRRKKISSSSSEGWSIINSRFNAAHYFWVL